MRFATLTLFLSGCYPALFVADRMPLQPSPPPAVPSYTYVPAKTYFERQWETLSPRERAEWQEHEDARVAKVAKAKADAEATERAEQEAKVKAITDARKDRLCKPTDDDRVCLKAHFLREDIATACSLADDVRSYQADVAYQWREGHKYGVVDLSEVESAKSMAQAKEDDLAAVAEKIKNARGRSFSVQRDCRQVSVSKD